MRIGQRSGRNYWRKLSRLNGREQRWTFCVSLNASASRQAVGSSEADPLFARPYLCDVVYRNLEMTSAESPGAHDEIVRAVGARLVAEPLDDADATSRRLDDEALRLAEPVVGVSR